MISAWWLLLIAPTCVYFGMFIIAALSNREPIAPDGAMVHTLQAQSYTQGDKHGHARGLAEGHASGFDDGWRACAVAQGGVTRS